MCRNVGGVSFFFFFAGEEKNKINSLKFALSYQKAKFSIILNLSLSFLSARLSFSTCCQHLASNKALLAYALLEAKCYQLVLFLFIHFVYENIC